MNWKIVSVNGKPYEKKYDVLPLTSKLFAASGMTSEQMEELLDPSSVLTTSQADCVLKACARIERAKMQKEKVFIAGDYDADGVCSTAIMKATLDALKIENGYYIPDRIKEGYGLHDFTVKMAAEKGYTLIITVDNGVKAHAALQCAKELHIDTIVSDHHVIEEPVECDILVHPTLMEAPYKYLSGAGVALEMSRNLIGNREDLNALAGVAAITDVMPMWRQTRKLVMKAMDMLKQGQPHSVASLLQPNSSVDETSIGFYIGPKLNSVGRMSDVANANTVPLFLLSKDDKQIAAYAAQLQQVNDLRKERASVETEIAEKEITDDDFLLIYHEKFHEGICGQIAGNIAGKYKKPTLVMARSGDVIKGSGRSVPGFDIFAFFSDFKEPCAFGGHSMAVGISVPVDQFDEFRKHIQEKIKTCGYTYTEEDETAIAIASDDVNFDSLTDLQRLSPYPSTLMKPNFVITDPEILERKDTAKMVRYRIANANGGFDAVLYKRKNITVLEKPHQLIGTLNLNRWNNKVTCQMVIEDMQ